VGPVVIPGHAASSKAVADPAPADAAAPAGGNAAASAAAPAGGDAPASGDAAASAGAPAEAGSAGGTDGAARPAAKRTATRRRRKPASQDDVQAAEPVNGTVLEGASEITEAPAATS
jgi:hypothetical protein